MSNAIYRGFGKKHIPFPLRGGKLHRDELPEFIQKIFDPIIDCAKAPYTGVTTDGTVIPGLYSLDDRGAATEAITDAAADYLRHLRRDQRPQAVLPLDTYRRRLWSNAFPHWEPHGVLLEEMDEGDRQRALAVLEKSFSARGYDLARKTLLFNQLLGELINDTANFSEFKYWFTIFGEPSRAQPWGWQLMGHHFDANFFVLGPHLVATPLFMGAEPRIVDAGRYAGLRAFDAEEQSGLEFIRSLSTSQQDKAILYRSMLSKDLPAHLAHPADGRTRSGAGADNLVLPYEGLAVTGMTAGQRELLLELIRVYAGRLPAGHEACNMDAIARHLDATHFAWIGRTDDESPFYYKIHSPVVLIEFDHHSGVMLDNPNPERFHTHTVVRTPNGNDYGMDLLRQHYERFPHGHGRGGHSHGPRR